MADVQLDTESTPGTPGAGTGFLYLDSTTKRLMNNDDGGNARGVLSKNFSTATQSPATTDTYITNSNVIVPTIGLQAGMTIRWFMGATKAAAGTGTPVYTIRLGSGLAITDTAIVALTADSAQTAAADNGLLVVQGVLQVAGASAVLGACALWVKSVAAATGFGGGKVAQSATFNSGGSAGLSWGLSINGGTASAWTVVFIEGELIG
jgi:hypothetical protein